MSANFALLDKHIYWEYAFILHTSEVEKQRRRRSSFLYYFLLDPGYIKFPQHLAVYMKMLILYLFKFLSCHAAPSFDAL